VRDETEAVRDMQQDPAFARPMQRARVVLIMPKVIKGSAGIGGKGGRSPFDERGYPGLPQPCSAAQRFTYGDIHIAMVHLPAVNTPQFDGALYKTKEKARPIPPIFAPEVSTKAIYFAATHRRREVWLGSSTAQAILGNRIAPGLLDRILVREGYSGELSRTPLPADAPSNLFEPMPGHATAPGRFDDKAKATSWEFFTDRHRDALRLGFACAGALVVSSFFSRRCR
jgi:hypothetical protein